MKFTSTVFTTVIVFYYVLFTFSEGKPSRAHYLSHDFQTEGYLPVNQVKNYQENREHEHSRRNVKFFDDKSERLNLKQIMGNDWKMRSAKKLSDSEISKKKFMSSFFSDPVFEWL